VGFYLFQRATNGLEASGAVVYRGRRLLIDEDIYLSWMTSRSRGCLMTRLSALLERMREPICRRLCGSRVSNRDASLVIDRLTVELETARKRVAELEGLLPESRGV
jgi:hypothetical protein